jgi:hypothetical protein
LLSASAIFFSACGFQTASPIFAKSLQAKHSPQNHIFEELIYIVSGRGAITVCNDGERKHTLNGGVFSLPLNAWHRHFNSNGAEPVRYLAVTTAPCMMNLIHNTDFIFNCNYVFRDRFADFMRDDVRSTMPLTLLFILFLFPFKPTGQTNEISSIRFPRCRFVFRLLGTGDELFLIIRSPCLELMDDWCGSIPTPN